jgi:hypothetical protein
MRRTLQDKAGGMNSPGGTGRMRKVPGDSRRQRLAAALRENLRKRKAQTRNRGKDGDGVDDRTPQADESPG